MSLLEAPDVAVRDTAPGGAAGAGGMGSVLADDEVRAVARPFLDEVCRGEQPLLSPLYFGPLESGEGVRREAEAVAADYGLACPENAGGGGVLVVGIEEAVRRVVMGRGERMVVWGCVPAAELPEVLRRAIAAGGLAVDPGQFRALLDGGWSMQPALERAAADPGRVSNPVVIVAGAEELAERAAEAQLRLAAAGCTPTRVVGLDGEAGGAVLPPAGGATVVRAAGLGSARARSAWIGLAEMAGVQGRQVVLVTDPESYGALAADPRWAAVAARAGTVRIAEESAPPGADVPWPDPAWVLLDGPVRRPEAPSPMVFDLAEVTLEEVLQSAAVFQREGYYLLYAPDRLAWIHVVGDRVHGAGRLGDPEGEVEVDAVQARVAEMGSWAAARMIFVRTRPRPGGPGEPGVEVGRMSAVVAMARDEAASGQPGAMAPPVPPVKAGWVAEALLGWGLGSVARELLVWAEQLSQWGPEEDLLAGHLAAGRDPVEAASRFRHALYRIGGRGADDPGRWLLQQNARLNLLFLEAVLERTSARAAWSQVERWLAAFGEGWVCTPRHAAMLALLAWRAGRREEARMLADRVRAAVGPGDELLEVIAPVDHGAARAR
ncbi:MAG: hypothetical protein AB1941_26775 [Gemmatimonadota bacterium]